MSRLIMSPGKLTACCDISAMSSISGVCVQLSSHPLVQELKSVSLVAKYIRVFIPEDHATVSYHFNAILVKTVRK